MDGVPLVSLKGSSLVGRIGTSMLARAGLVDLIAESPAGYVRIAADLAGDLPRLAALGTECANDSKASTLVNGKILARETEQIYRDLWRRWCRT